MGDRDGPALSGLDIADPTDLWDTLGFTVGDHRVVVAGIEFRLDADGHGIVGWNFDRALAPRAGLPAWGRPQPRCESSDSHPNGIIGVDHVVLLSPDVNRSRQELAGSGIEIRRERTRNVGGTELTYLFSWVGATILETVGPADDGADGPARLWGVTFMAPDLDRTRTALGPPAGPIRPAVQPGRSIVSLDTRDDGGTTRLAVMSPHEPARPGSSPSPRI